LVRTGAARRLYANAPLGDVGDICRQGNNIVMDTFISNPVKMMEKIIPHLLRMVDEAGIDLPPNPFGILTGLGVGLLAQLLPTMVPPGVGGETAAAVTAARLALTFFIGSPPTRPHITYDTVEVLSGRTYLQLGVDHVRNWAGHAPVRGVDVREYPPGGSIRVRGAANRTAAATSKSWYLTAKPQICDCRWRGPAAVV
jgi:hypothetical protein